MKEFFNESLRIAELAGIPKEHIILDPGIGFGKTFEQNIYVLQNLNKFMSLPYPFLLGTSRKGFLGKILDMPVTERVEGTGTTCVLGIAAGCNIVRVHDVKEIARMCRVADVLCGNENFSVQ